MITLYNFAGGGRGLRVGWQCEEMELPYEAVLLGYPVPADYRAKYPPGSTPFLEDEGGVAIGESVAMMLYLAGRYGPTPLVPSNPADLAQVMQLTVFSEATIGGAMNALMATKFAAPEDQKVNWTNGVCQSRAEASLAYAASLLGDRDFLVGESLTLADIAVATALGIWKGALDGEIPAPLAAHRERMMARPAYQRAWARLGRP